MAEHTDFGRAVESAIAREKAAYRLYDTQARASDMPAVSSLLTELASQEAAHRRVLEGLDPQKARAFEHALTAKFRLADYLREAVLTPHCSLPEMLLYAIQREAEIRDFYARIAEALNGQEMAEVFQRLSTAEERHRIRLESLRRQVGAGDDSGRGADG